MHLIRAGRGRGEGGREGGGEGGEKRREGEEGEGGREGSAPQAKAKLTEQVRRAFATPRPHRHKWFIYIQIKRRVIRR